MEAPIVVVGQPCTGKSTLGSSLQNMLSGYKHISVGDLIRADRDSRGSVWPLDLRNAFDGRRGFPADFISKLVTESWRDCQELQGCILDGGPPLGAALRKIDVAPLLSIVLEASDAVREDRFQERRRHNLRTDDSLDLFRRRSAQYRLNLAETLVELADLGPQLHLDANAETSAVLYQALSATLLSRVVHHHRRRLTNPNSATVASAAKLALDRPGRSVRVPAVDGSTPVSPIMIIKPGFEYGPNLVAAVDECLAPFGYTIGELVVWTDSDLKQAGMVAAHFDRQWIYSQYASALLEPAVRGGQEIADEYTLDSLNAWEASHPAKVGPGRWQADLRLPDGSWIRAVNGHMPGVVRGYLQPGAFVTALRLVARPGASCARWRELRRDLLGTTDPRLATPSSLRGKAYGGALPLSGEVSFQNNAFHLSAGPLEAIRERLIWFGPPACSSRELSLLLNLATEKPDPAGEGSFASTECMDWYEILPRLAGWTLLPPDLLLGGEEDPAHLLARLTGWHATNGE